MAEALVDLPGSDAPIPAAKPWERDWSANAAQPKPWERKWAKPEPVAAQQVAAETQSEGVVIDGAKNLAKGIGERFVQLEGGAVRSMATALPGSDPVSDFIYWATGRDKPANYPTPEEVTKTGQEVAKQMESVDLGFEEGDTWDDVKKAPASKFLPWALKQGLLSAPDMALAMASLPGYAAIRSGELAQDRAENDARADATVDDMLRTAPAAVVSGLLDRIGGRAMFGLDDVAIQSLKQVPKEVAKATVKEGVTEGLQEGVESTATTLGTEKGFDPAQTAEQMLAGSLAGGVTGGTVRTGTGTVEAILPKNTPVEGGQSETVETENPQLPTPVTRDDGGEVDSPLPSSPSSATPEERAVLRRTSMPDEDIDAMSREEIDAKIAEARAAGIRVNGAMVRAAEQYRAPQPEPTPQSEESPVDLPVEQPVDAKAAARKMLQDYQDRKAADQQQDAQAEQAVQDAQPALASTVLRSVYEDTPRGSLPRPEPVAEAQTDPKAIVARQIAQFRAKDAQAANSVAEVRPDLESAVRSNLAGDVAEEARVDEALGAPLAVQVQRSLYEDRAGEGSRLSPKRVELPEDIEVATQRVNTEPSEAQKLAGNYQKGHIKVLGLDVTIENPKGSTRSGTSPNGQQWSVEMPAHYGYVKRSSGADGDQVDVYVGDNPASKRVYVVDQRDPATRRFDEHKAIMGAGSLTEARDLYARAFSDRSGMDRIGAITPMSISEFRAWLREGDTTKPVRMGKGVKLNDQGFPVDGKGAVKKPDSLIEFLARKGGVREDGGELTALGLRDRRTGFVVGAGPLIRPKGMHPDKAREAAAEAGYLPAESTVADFYDALDADARSGRQQFSQYDDDWAAVWRHAQGEEARRAEEEAAEAAAYEEYRQNEPSEEERERQSIYIRLLDEGYPGVLGDDFSQRVARYVMAGETFEDAVFYAYDEKRKEAISTTPGMPPIPFFGDETNEAFAGTATEGEPGVEPGSLFGDDSGSEVGADGTVGSGEVRSEGRAEGDRQRGEPVGQKGDDESLRRSNAVNVRRQRLLDTDRDVDGIKVSFDDDTHSRVFDLGNKLIELNGVTVDSALEADFPRNVRLGELKDDAADLFAEIGPFVESGDMPLRNVGDFARIAMNFAADVAAEVSAKKNVGMAAVESPTLISEDYQRAWTRQKTEILRNELVGDRPAAVSPPRPAEERGADNKPQLVIPGAERASDKTMAQRAADAPLKPKAPQKDPGGLFSDEMDQRDLLDFSIAPDENTNAFKTWFGESKVVEEDGNPLVVYHGTGADIEAFDPAKRGSSTREPDARRGFFFSSNPDIANEYAMEFRKGGANVVPAYLSLQNPYEIDHKGGDYDPDAFNEYINAAEDGGHDGVIIRNAGDGMYYGGSVGDTYIAFKPTQIKSINNRGTFDPKDPRLSYSSAPDGWGFADAGEAAPKLSEKEQKRLIEIVSRTAGIDPTFVDSINVPKGTKALEAWGKGDEENSTAAGFYSPMRDIITLALDTAPVRAGKVAYHESFHRLQNLFLNDKERKLLKAEDARLRKMIADKGEYPQATVDKMSRKEVEAEAFGIWADRADNAGVHIGIRKVWKNIRDMLARVRNYLHGMGFQTVDDVFGKAKSGETATRQKQEPKSTGKDYSIVDRAPDKPLKPSAPTAPAKPRNRFSDRLSAVSKAMAAKAKSKGGRFDRLTEDDGETFGDLATRKVLDYLDPVLKMQEKAGGNLNEVADAYLTARLAEGTIRHELHQVDEKYVQPAIKELAAVGATEKDLHEYMYAMHAPERNRVVGLRNEEGSDLYKAATDPTVRGASGMSTNEAKKILADLAKDREKFIGIRRAASHIRAMLDDGLKRQLKAGLINKASYDELTQQWQHYVPLRAESDQDGVGGGMPSKSRGFDVRGDEFKGATGRYTKADNVVNYAVNNAEQSIIRAEKNKAATAALRFINQFDPEGESIAKVYWSEDPEKLGDITKAPPVYRRKLDKDGKVTNQRVNAFQMKDDVLAAKVGGKTYYMQFADPKVGLALKKMTFGELGATMKMIKSVSNWQSLINTRANPAFVPINMLRDIQTGATLAMNKDFKAGEIAKMVGSIPKAWGALWRDARGKQGSGKWDKVVADFKANGGKISFDQYNTVEETAKKIQKELHRASTRGSAGKLWRGFVDLVENLNDTIENGMRVAVYNAAVERGQTPKRAAFLARDLTVDFQKKGEITPHMNALYTFFNASVQGNTNFAKALYRSRKVKVAMGALIMAGYAQHVMNLAMAGDDDDGENAYLKMLRNEPWTFERNIVLFLPGSKEYIKLPLGFGMNAFWHFGAQAGAVTTGDKGFLDATLDSTRVAFDAFNPLGSGGWVAMALPSVIDPIWELGTNQNFSGNPIYPQENQYDPAPPPKSEQAFSSTSPAFRWGAETLNKISGGSDKLPGAIDVYPDSLEHLWGWFTGGLGRFASQSVETAQRGVDLDFEPKKTPFIRSFYGAVDDQGKRGEYFAQREKVQYVKGKIKEFQEADDAEGLKDFMADHPQERKAIEAFDAAEKMRRKLNKQRRKLERIEGSADQLKKLDDQEIEIMNRARKAYFEAGKAE